MTNEIKIAGSDLVVTSSETS